MHRILGGPETLRGPNQMAHIQNITHNHYYKIINEQKGSKKIQVVKKEIFNQNAPGENES